MSALRHETAASQVEIEPSTAEQYLLDAVNGGAFQHLRHLPGVDEASEDPLENLATGSDPANDEFIFSQLRDLVDSISTKKHFLRNLRNREEDVAVRRSQPPSANYQAFLFLTAVVYKSLPPDSAQHLWDNINFTGTVLDSRGGWPGPALWEMLAAISTGPICAAKSYEKIKDTRFQWNSLFKFYQHYYEIMPHLFEPIKTSRSTSLDPMAYEDKEMCKGWTHLLATVVSWSPLARSALLQAKPHPLQMLFDFLNCDIPLDLKATVLEAITAFCRRTGDTADDDVLCKAVDFYERISFVNAEPIGWIAKMEYTEQDVNTYPLTRAYINFLTALLPNSPPRLTNALRRGVAYILDRVLLVPRRYLKQSEQWEMLDAIMAFMERALLGFDMSGLQGRAIGSIATALSEEPGFLVLLRLLSEPEIFAVMAGVVDGEAPRDVLRRVLRIYHLVLDIQIVFSDVLLLTLSDPTRNAQPFKRPLGLQSLDQYLLAHLSNVNAIALLVGDDDLAISFLSIKIFTALASSPIFSRSDVFRGEYSTSVNRLAGIIDASDDSIRIAQGFCIKLAGDGEDIPPEELAAAEAEVLRGQASEASPLMVRSAILDLLVDGTDSDNGPNLAHFLLGFEFKGSSLVLADSRSSCLQVVLEQLGDGADLHGSSSATLVSLHPVLAAKSARLIYQLFSHPSTGQTAISYAMSVAGFSARQLASLPRMCPPATRDNVEGLGVVTVNHTELVTSADTLVAFLDHQRYILSSVALETFAFDGHGASASHVAESLFHDSVDAEPTPPLITDLLSCIDMQWREDLPDDRPLEFYGGFDFDQFKRADADWWDLPALDRALRASRRSLERQGAVTAGTSAKADYITRRLGMKNRETDISLAKGNFLTAWNEALKVSLAMLFQHISEGRQEVVLFELLDALLDRFDGEMASGVREIICESVLVTLTTLVNTLVDYDGVNLPVERLVDILRKTIAAVVRPGTTENARGNLYAALSQHLQLLTITPNSIADDASVVTTVPIAQSGSLHRATLRALETKRDRLLPVLCRDAMDDRDVWKTECFALLGGIVSICQNERDRQILSPLTKEGFLQLFVRSIKDREIALQECLSPDAGKL